MLGPILVAHFIASMLKPSKRKRKHETDRIVFRCAHGKTPIRPNRFVPRNPCPRQASFRHIQKSNV